MPPPSPDKEMKKLDFNWNPEFKQIDRSMPRLCAIRDVDVPPPAVVRHSIHYTGKDANDQRIWGAIGARKRFQLGSQQRGNVLKILKYR